MGAKEPPKRGIRFLGTTEEALVPNFMPAELARNENLDEPAHVHEKVGRAPQLLSRRRLGHVSRPGPRCACPGHAVLRLL